MATVSTADFKNGMCIVYNGKMCIITEFQHVKPGKGGAFVRMKMRDIKTGRVLSDTVNSGVKFDTVRLEQREMQYLYNDGSDFYFMDPVSFDQISLPADHVGDTAQCSRKTTPPRSSTPMASCLASSPRCSLSSKSPKPSPASRATPFRFHQARDARDGRRGEGPMFVEVGDVLQIDTRDGRFIKRM